MLGEPSYVAESLFVAKLMQSQLSLPFLQKHVVHP